METAKGVKIEGSEISGDIAGNNIDKSIHHHYSGSKGTYMKALLDKFKEEQKMNLQITTFIDELDYYYNKKADDLIGLQEKLTLADRQDLIDFAEDFKDRFQRKLFQFQHSEAAQNIMLHLLADVQSRFVNDIFPLICNQANVDQVNSLISEKIIDPVKEELDENLLGITAQHINGMIYFLTGNCHIRWTR